MTRKKSSKRKKRVQASSPVLLFVALLIFVVPFYKSQKKDSSADSQNEALHKSTTTSEQNTYHTNVTAFSVFDSTLLECPLPSSKGNTILVTHKVDEGKTVNYSLEYDTQKHHARWVAFSFDNYTAQTGSKRNEAWGWDPLISTKYEVKKGDFKGFSRGHLVASNDRTFSVDANKQTFYYSNMSPQRQKHNDGVWLQLEQLVQRWGRTPRMRDKLYVVKGGTLEEDQIEKSWSNGKIAVPKYYWIALLLEKNGSYYSIAFWTEHQKPQRVASPKTLAIPVAVLQQRTGIDFFHLLPDKVEQEIENQNPRHFLHIWRGLE